MERYRYATMDDLSDILAMLADPRVGTWLYFVPAPEEALRAYMEPLIVRQAEEIAELGEPRSAIFVVESEDGTFLGEAAVLQVDHSPDGYEIGFQLRPEAWGRGVGTRVGRYLADWAIDRGAYRLEANCLEGNVASRRILEGLGLRVEGRRPGYRHKDGVRHTELLLGCVVGE